MDTQLVLIGVLVAALAALAWWRGGAPLVRAGLGGGFDLLLRFGALIVVSFLAAGLAQALVPPEWFRTALGEQAGLRGILLATAAGMATPAGPFVSLPLAAVMLRAGAAPPAVVAFVTAWAVLAIHRLVAWELPILGFRFALLRFGVSAVLPIAAGLLARAVTALGAR